MRLAYAGLAAIGFSLCAGAATAAPTVSIGDINATPSAEPVASWRYHRSCGWRDGRWVVDLGGGKLVVCRPNRPGRNWVWFREGNREGWYDRRRKDWHHKNW